MGVFVPEEIPLFSYEAASRLEQTFTQKPTRIPLELPLYPTPYIVREPTNYVPIVAIVGLLGFFAFLGFLAYLKRS